LYPLLSGGRRDCRPARTIESIRSFDAAAFTLSSIGGHRDNPFHGLMTASVCNAKHWEPTRVKPAFSWRSPRFSLVRFPPTRLIPPIDHSTFTAYSSLYV
jgi:hypothetical protein